VFGSRVANFRLRVLYSSGLVGGPIALESSIAFADRPFFVVLSGDRDTWKVSADIDGVPLGDPYPDYFYSGPIFPAGFAAAEPRVEAIELGQYVRLEDVVASGELTVTAARVLSIGATQEEALSARPETLFKETLSIPLLRDDAALAALVDRLVDDVEHGPPEKREPALSRLTALRAPIAVERWRRLAMHREPMVAERVRGFLDSMARRR